MLAVFATPASITMAHLDDADHLSPEEAGESRPVRSGALDREDLDGAEAAGSGQVRGVSLAIRWCTARG